MNKLNEIKGLAYKRDGKIRINPLRPPIPDLDSLPFPARHLLPMHNYFNAAKKRLGPRPEICKPWITMITSRGCPYQCVFCSIHSTMGRKWRARSPENVINEIKEAVDKYHIRQIDFEDDNMTLDKKRIEAICDLIIKERLDIEWYTPNGIRADTLDESLLKKMKRAGCKRIYVSPESGVQRIVNEVIKKNLDLRKVKRAVYLARKVGIKVSCYFVVGVIGETKEDVKKSIAFAEELKKLGADRFYFSIETPYYGTELYLQAKQQGFLRETPDVPFIETPELSQREKEDLCTSAQVKLNPVFTRENVIRAVLNPTLTLDSASTLVRITHTS